MHVLRDQKKKKSGVITILQIQKQEVFLPSYKRKYLRKFTVGSLHLHETVSVMADSTKVRSDKCVPT